MSDQKGRDRNTDKKTNTFQIQKTEEKTEVLLENDNDTKLTQLLSDERDDKTELLFDVDANTSLLNSNHDEETEMLSDLKNNVNVNLTDNFNDENEMLFNNANHAEKSLIGEPLMVDCEQQPSFTPESFSRPASDDSEQNYTAGDEPTEELLDEVTLPQRKRKNIYIIFGIVAGVCILTALTFFVLDQIKTSEINKSLELGEQYLEEGKYEEAILAFDEVIAIEPKQVAAYEGKGSANINLKNYAEAEAQLETAKAIDYTDNGKLLMSDVYINTERKDQGKALLDEVTNKQSEETKIVLYASKLYAEINEFNKVIDLLEKKITYTTDKAELKKLYDQLINAYVKAGKTETEILALLERAASATEDRSYLDKKEIYMVKKPSFNLAPGEYQGTQTLDIVKGNATDKVYYTIDGSEPNIDSTEYISSISLQPGEITVKIIEINASNVKSKIQEGKYIVIQNKLTNEEFINKLYGVWYNESNFNMLHMTNTTFFFIIPQPLSICGGKYNVLDTTANGGTINVLNYKVREQNYGDTLVEFDFGIPNDNKIRFRIANNEWQEYNASENIGNGEYRNPSSFKDVWMSDTTNLSNYGF